MKITTVGTTLAAAVLLAGCSAGVSVGGSSDKGGEEISADELAGQVTDKITPKNSSDEVSTDCEDPLPREEDAEVDCVVTVGADKAYVKVGITGDTDASKPDLSVEPYAPAQQVEEAMTSSYAAQGTTLDSVSCPEDLEAKEGEEMECDVASGDQKATAVAKVASVDGLRINLTFSIQK